MSHKGPFSPAYNKYLVPHKLLVYSSDVVVKYRTRGWRPPPPETRETIGEFTYASRRRLAFVASNTAVEFRSMLTLTYPSEFPTFGSTVKRQLKTMIKRLRRRWGSLSFLWFLEFQKRGAPHVHLLLSVHVKTSDKKWCSAAWYKIVKSGDPKHLAAGTNLQNVRKSDGAARYAVKYAMKMRQKKVPERYQNVGRFWGHSRDVIPREMTAPIFVSDLGEVRKLAAGWQYADRLHKPLSVLYNAAGVVATNATIDKRT